MLKLLKFITGIVIMITLIITIKLVVLCFIKSENRIFVKKLGIHKKLFQTHFVNQFVFLWSPMTRVNGQQMIALSGVGPNKFKIEENGNENILRFQKDLFMRRRMFINQLDDDRAMHSIILDAIYQKRENGYNPYIVTNKKKIILDENNNPIEEIENQQTINENPLHTFARQAAFQSFKQDGLFLPIFYQELTQIFSKNIYLDSLYIVKLDLFYAELTKLPFINGHELYLLHFSGSTVDLYEVAQPKGKEAPKVKNTRMRSDLTDLYHGTPLKFMNSFDLGVDSVLSFSYLLKKRSVQLVFETLEYVEPHASFYTNGRSEYSEDASEVFDISNEKSGREIDEPSPNLSQNNKDRVIIKDVETHQ